MKAHQSSCLPGELRLWGDPWGSAFLVIPWLVVVTDSPGPRCTHMSSSPFAARATSVTWKCHCSENTMPVAAAGLLGPAAPFRCRLAPHEQRFLLVGSQLLICLMCPHLISHNERVLIKPLCHTKSNVLQKSNYPLSTWVSLSARPAIYLKKEMKMKTKTTDPLGWTPVPCKHPDTPAAMVVTTSLLSWCQTSTSAPCLGHAFPLGHPKYCAHLRSSQCP